MTGVGGSIESVTIAGRRFSVAADADSNRKLGGDENDVQANGDGTGRIIKTVTPWSLDGLTLSIDDSLGDQDAIKQFLNRNAFFPIVITYASGVSYQGNGTVTGEVQASSQNTTLAVTLMGAGNLTRQV